MDDMQMQVINELSSFQKKCLRDSARQTKAFERIADALEKLAGISNHQELSQDQLSELRIQADAVYQWIKSLNDSKVMTCPIEKVDVRITKTTGVPRQQLYFAERLSKDEMISLRKELRRLAKLEGLDLGSFYIHGQKKEEATDVAL